MKPARCFACLLACALLAAAHAAEPDLTKIADPGVWRVHNRSASAVSKRPNSVRLDARAGDGVAWLVGSEFGEGTIEVDLRGANKPGQSFVGLAFRGADDTTFDAVYFRAFNFQNSDPVRRSRAVQYVSMPQFPWERLRNESPGKYEATVNPVPEPDGWFHARIVIADRKVSVFVNDATEPCLVVTELTTRPGGMIGLWVGNGSAGDFANLRITPAVNQNMPAANLLKPVNQPDSWTLQLNGGGEGTLATDGESIVFRTSRITGTPWHVQAFQEGVALKEQRRYTVRFAVRSREAVPVLLTAAINQADWHNVGLQEVIATSDAWTEHEFKFLARQVTGSDRLGFLLGAQAGTVAIKDLHLAETESPYRPNVAAEQRRGDYLGEKPPGAQPELFAPGLVSTFENETRGGFSPDGSAFVFSIDAPDRARIMLIRCTGEVWTPASVAPFSGTHSDFDPAFSPDGQAVWFCSQRPHTPQGAPRPDADIWRVLRQGDGWGEAERLGPAINTDGHQYHPSESTRGNLFLASSRAPQPDAMFHGVAVLKDGSFQPFAPLEPVVNEAPYNGDLYVTPDESTLIMVKHGRGDTRGDDDLYISFRQPDGAWSLPRNMGDAVNTPAKEFCPALSPDGRYFFFTRSVEGNGDIYWMNADFIQDLKSQAPTPESWPLISGDFFGQVPPTEKPSVFEPPALASRFRYLSRMAFSHDQQECFFTVSVAHYGDASLRWMRREGNAWTAPVVPDFGRRSGIVIDSEPFFSSDGRRLIFTSDRDRPASGPGTNDFWFVERTAGDWSEPRRLEAPINTEYGEFCYSDAADGTIWFVSDRPGGLGGFDVWRALRDAGGVLRVENAGANVNFQYNEWDPAAPADGHCLIFASVRPGGKGGSDLYISFNDGHGGWTAAENLGDGFNTPHDEFCATYSHDGRALFFTRHSHDPAGRSDVLWIATSALPSKPAASARLATPR